MSVERSDPNRVDLTFVLMLGEGFRVSTVKLPIPGGGECFETLVFPASKRFSVNCREVQDPKIALYNVTRMETLGEARGNHKKAVNAARKVLGPLWWL